MNNEVGEDEVDNRSRLQRQEDAMKPVVGEDVDGHLAMWLSSSILYMGAEYRQDGKQSDTNKTKTAVKGTSNHISCCCDFSSWISWTPGKVHMLQQSVTPRCIQAVQKAEA